MLPASRTILPRSERAVLWDGAIHVYDDAYALRPGLKQRPASAGIDDYLKKYAPVGLDRVVLSQASAYCFDNSLLLDTLEQLEGRGRGFVVLPPASNRTLEGLHARGVRGVRFLMTGSGALTWDDVAPWSDRAAEMGWVLKFQLDGPQFHHNAELLSALKAKILIDVYPGTLDLSVETTDRLCRLLQHDHVWISLSTPTEPNLSAIVMAKTLLTSAPLRCIWSSNWPNSMTATNALGWLKDLRPG